MNNTNLLIHRDSQTQNKYSPTFWTVIVCKNNTKHLTNASMCIVKFYLQHYIFVKVFNNIITIITYQFGSYDTIQRGDIFFEIAPTFFDFFCAKIFQVQKMGTTGTASTSAPP